MTAVTLGSFGHNDGSAVVVPAIRTCPVGQLMRVAIRAFGGSRRGRLVMRPAFAPAGFRVAAFRIRHGRVLLTF